MPTQSKSWRDVLQVHPAADLFPMMSPDELRELGEDIKAHGLREPVTLWSPGSFLNEIGEVGTEPVTPLLLGGRNRLTAAEMVGLQVSIGGTRRFTVSLGDEQRFSDVGAHHFETVVSQTYDETETLVWIREPDVPDPYAYVVSDNIRRRHLTAEQKRDLIGEVLKAQPEKSNRQIAAQVNADHKTVGAIRGKLEATGEIPKLETTVGKDGKARPAERRAAPAMTLAQDPAAVAITTPKPGVLKPPGSASSGKRLHKEKIDEIVRAIDAIHRIAGIGMDVTPKEVLASRDTDGKRTNLIGSARLAHKWLGELLQAGRP